MTQLNKSPISKAFWCVHKNRRLSQLFFSLIRNQETGQKSHRHSKYRYERSSSCTDAVLGFVVGIVITHGIYPFYKSGIDHYYTSICQFFKCLFKYLFIPGGCTLQVESYTVPCIYSIQAGFLYAAIAIYAYNLKFSNIHAL